MKNPHRILISSLFLLLALRPAGAQQGSNPFELIPRLEPEEAVQATHELLETRGTGNPFDLIAPSTVAKSPAPAAIRPARPGREEHSQRFLFSVTLVLLLLFATLITLFRSYFQRSFRAFLNDNMLNQAQRDQESGRALPFFLFYFFFLLNAGLYIFQLTRFFGYTLSPSPWYGFLFCLLGISGLFLLKHTLLGVIGYIFPVIKESSLYNFMIVIFGIILGAFLLLINLLIAYAPPKFTDTIVHGSFILIGLTYIFRSLRGLFVAGRFLAFHKFHFLLYICTVEIAPVLILIKLIFKQL